MTEAIWTNPKPLGQGREESLRVVMQAVMEGKDFTEEEKVVMRQMWINVLAGEKKLEDFRHLVERTTPLPPPLSSPIYESTETLAMEAQVAAAVGKVMGFDRWEKYQEPAYITPDYLFYKGGAEVACAEIRRRYVKWAAYPDFRIDKKKIISLIAYSPRAMLVVACNDCFGYLYPASAPKHEGVIERKDRNDTYDKDDGYCFNWGDFTILGKRGSLYPLKPYKKLGEPGDLFDE